MERFQNEVKDFVLNPILDEILKEELEAVGETVVTKRSRGKGSTDAGNISYEVPTAHPHIKIGPDDLIAHTNEFREAAKSSIGDEAIIKGAQALATTGYRLLSDSVLLNRVNKAFEAAKIEKDSSL